MTTKRANSFILTWQNSTRRKPVVMKFFALRAFYVGTLVIVLLLVIVYLCKAPQKAWQFNFARKSNEVLSGGNFAQHENSSIQRRGGHWDFRFCGF